MINIAIFDQNEIHRASLKILLEQIDGFRVVLDSDNLRLLSSSSIFPPDVVLIDNSEGNDTCNNCINELQEIMPGARAIVLVMFREELEFDFGKAEVVLKSSDKKEFETRIKNLVKY